MRILFFTRLYYPHTGGVERHIKEISRVLIKKGHDVTIVTTKFEKDLSSEEDVDGVRVIRFVQPDIKIFGLLYTWIWFFKNINLIKKSDIVHIHDVFIWYWPFRIIFPYKKVFVTNHGQWGKYPLTFMDVLQKRISRKCSDGVISIGEYIDKNYGIKSDVLAYGATEKPKKVGLVDKIGLLYVGRLDNITGLPVFLKMLDKEKSGGFKLNVIFCGEGELRRKCEKYGKVLGWRDPEPYYERSKYVFASGYLTIFEALAHKCLVFSAYQNPMQKDYYEMTPFSKFIITADNSESLSKIFKYYKNNSGISDKLTNAGFKWVQDQTWENMTQSYLLLWKSGIQ